MIQIIHHTVSLTLHHSDQHFEVTSADESGF